MAAIVVVAAGWGLYFFSKSDTGSVTLSWNANSEENIGGYKIYYGEEQRTGKCPKGGYANVVDAGKDTKYEIKNLKRDVTYYFSTTSYNTEGKESCFSDEVSKKVGVLKIPVSLMFWKK